MSKEKQIEEMAKIICSSHNNNACVFNHEPCDFKCSAYGNANDLYTAGYRKQSDWIRVDERLPERQGAYLVFTCDRRISMCHFIDHYCDGNMQFDDYRVTHWMPLPEPPKMKGE